ncbi:MAG TPA: hypothetical protein VG755_36565 [Nannocystaceae bacterium]|nr:hypothetical protein [Nannocystaceae bacterium]
MHRPALAPCLLATLLAACGSDDPSGVGEGDGTGDSGNVEESEGGSTPGSADGSSGNADESESGGTPMGDVPARGGITITRVEANPGVAVPIAENGSWVGGGGRNAPLIKNRNTAFRVYVDVDEASWVPRVIRARLTVTQSDGRETVYEEVGQIDTDSSPTSLQSNILLGAIADDIQPGAHFQVELFEGGTGWESLPEVDTPPVALNDGPAEIGIEPSDQFMRMVIVPVDYSFGSCTTSVDLTPEALQPYEDAMYQQNPLESIEIEVHAPISVNDLDLSDGGDFFQLLNRAVQLRASDSPDPNVYYYVLFDNCGACISESGGCLLGVAPGTPGASEGEASQRVAIGTRYLSNDEVGIETFVHEIGHTQGREHVACPGAQAAGPDITYPYEGGSIGVWGFGVRDFEIRNPSNHKDYMSYCNPTWVSDWQWSATFARAKTLSGWQFAVTEPPHTTMLVGTMNTDTGESHWWTEPGLVTADDERTATSQLAVLGEAGETHVAAADVDAWSEGPWVTVRANLPDGADAMAAAQAFELRMPGKTTRIARDRVRFDLVKQR